ncbi:hypothetical protein TOPH_07220 [Tolypocladium ophioglossoides CBS 100239]|uniref:Uncharacterized protein n=1 Tax=Tolypocladium ophioglossoides (strain CBS 100239) TaxID=1163406 RepID=A0A0L0N278_TOLOC|nr:hypothetical protein TOPH_07220 [Tolypocladium ophioglossoides CBS 100239]
MADAPDVWVYSPSFALAVLGSIVYGLLFLALAYLTFVRYRAWYFTVVFVGAAVEVAAYVLRTVSTQDRSDLLAYVMTLSVTVLAPVFVAAGNYLLISYFIGAVLPQSHHRILGIPGKRLTPIFVSFDIIAFMI